jgi:PAS domain S-box-containing protein
MMPENPSPESSPISPTPDTPRRALVDAWSVLSSLPVPVAVHDMTAEGKGLFVNPAFVQTFGFTLEDVPTVSAWAERVYPDPAYRQFAMARWWAEIQARVEQGTYAPPSEYRLVNKFGNPRDVLIGFCVVDGLVIVTMDDVTAVRATEAALAAEACKNDLTAYSLTENMPAGAYTMVLAPGEALAHFAFVSQKFLDMLELTREEAVGDPSVGFSRVHPEDRPRWLQANIDAFANKAPFSAEARVIANGETRWIRAESVPRDLEDGSIIWEGILVDITALKETELRLNSVLVAANAYTWRRDLRKQRSEFDARWAKLVGHNPDERDMPSDRWAQTVHPEDAVQVKAAVTALESGAVDHHIMTYRRQTVGGDWLWLQVHAGISERDRDGTPTALSGVSFDITKHKETEQRLQAIIAASQAMTWHLDLKSERLEFTEGWTAMHGYPLEENVWSLQSWLENIHPDDLPRLMVCLNRLRTGSSSSENNTHRRRHRDGHWLWLQVHAGISERGANDKPTAISGVSFDITAQVAARAQAQEEQAQLREDLQRAQQRDTVAQVAGGVAHDVNNLIAVIAGTAEMLELQSADEPIVLDGLHRIRRAVDMARDLIGGFGALVRPEQPRHIQDLRRALQDGVDLLGSRRIAQHDVRIETPTEFLPVWANPTEISQVIVNLALNACDSGTPERAATVKLSALSDEIHPPTRRPDAGEPPVAGASYAMFTVSDTGTGISDDVRARMFSPNFTTKGKAGTGLGLRIVSNILQRNRAALWVDTTLGEQTTITVAWPRHPPATDAANPPLPDSMGSAQSGTVIEGMLDDMHVLVVDDLLDVAEVLAGMLEAAGATALTEFDPQEAQQVLAEAPEIWSVLVTDLHMQGLDGRSLARFAASLNPPIPTVLVTARPDTLGEGQASEFAAVLSKPVSAAQLAQAVYKAAGMRSALLGDE